MPSSASGRSGVPSPPTPPSALARLRLPKFAPVAFLYGPSAPAATPLAVQAAPCTEADEEEVVAAEEAIFREMRTRYPEGPLDAGTAETKEEVVDASEGGRRPLLARFRSAALVARAGRRFERIRVSEADFRRYGGNLEQLRRRQVPPIADQDPELSYREAFELSCRQRVEPRDPWLSVPNAEAVRPAYEQDLILNQIIPCTPPKRCGSSLAASTVTSRARTLAGRGPGESQAPADVLVGRRQFRRHGSGGGGCAPGAAAVVAAPALGIAAACSGSGPNSVVAPLPTLLRRGRPQTLGKTVSPHPGPGP
mmetsp:Transcript_21907/g.46559  ORF Transcript_21907/g.46559 Transcript_21907/m.46559 type:complete len:309 (-) Transcript_21907:34-960(-)